MHHLGDALATYRMSEYAKSVASARARHRLGGAGYWIGSSSPPLDLYSALLAAGCWLQGLVSLRFVRSPLQTDCNKDA